MAFNPSVYGRPHGFVYPPDENQQFVQAPDNAYHRWLNTPTQTPFIPADATSATMSHVFSTNNKYAATWLFLDLECTQLDYQARDFGILEIAAAIVDNSMEVVDTFHVIINQPFQVIAASSKWCKKRFCSRLDGGNDLFAQCAASVITEEQAGKMLEEFILKHAKQRHIQPDEAEQKRQFFQKAELEPIETAIEVEDAITTDKDTVKAGGIEFYRVMLAGCSVYFDRAVLLHKFPHLKNLIGHKTIELSSLLEIARKWRPDLLSSLPPARDAHRALVDVLESVALLRWFWRFIIVS